ncbi:12968_t:CDS:1, partial [Ambispora gerdemannii]
MGISRCGTIASIKSDLSDCCPGVDARFWKVNDSAYVVLVVRLVQVPTFFVCSNIVSQLSHNTSLTTNSDCYTAMDNNKDAQYVLYYCYVFEIIFVHCQRKKNSE